MDEPQPSFSLGRRWGVGVAVIISVMAVGAIVAMANLISARYVSQRFQVSSQTRMQLAPQTLGLLRSITNDVKITVYYDRDAPLFTTLQALLQQYTDACPRLTVVTVDYVRQPAEAAQVKAHYKLSGAAEKDLIIFDCGGNWKVAPGAALAKYEREAVPNEREIQFRLKTVAFKGELMFSSMLLYVTSPKPLKACFLQGHGEHSLDSADEGSGFLTFGGILRQSYVQVEPVTLVGGNALPGDCNLLIVAAPQTALLPAELEKIDHYLSNGGRMLALFNFNSANVETGLERLLAKWGLLVIADVVRDPQNTTTGSDVIVSSFSSHPVVNALQTSRLHLVMPRPVGRTTDGEPPANAPRVDQLCASGPNSVLVSRPGQPPQPYPLIAAIEQGAVKGVASAATRIMVVGDSYCLANHYINSAANRDFLNYATAWLLDRPELMQGLGPRPLTEFKLAITKTQMHTAQVTLLGVLPGAVLAIGWFVWLRRRR